MLSEGPLTCSQVPVGGSYPESDVFDPRLHSPLKIHLNIILPFVPSHYMRIFEWKDDSERWIGKDVEEIFRGLFKILCQHLNGRTEETTKYVNHDKEHPSQVSNLEAPDICGCAQWLG